MHHVVVFVSRVFMNIFRDVSEDRCLLPAAYEYPPINGSQYYLPPRQDHSGDLACDCNTVMYKYEDQPPKGDPVLICLSV